MMPCCSSPFQCLAIPLRKSGSGFVGALKKLQQRQLRRGSAAHIVIKQEEFSQILTVESLLRTNRGGRQSRWFWSGIGIESRGRETVIARPEPTTDHFMRVGFPRHAIGPWTLWRAPSRKKGECQVEAAPEKMDGAALADKSGPECFKDFVRLRQDAPEAVSIFCIIRGMHKIFITADGICHFTWQRVDDHIDIEGAQSFHKLAVKIRDRAWYQWHDLCSALAGLNEEVVIDEVKIDFKGAASIGNGRRCQPTCREIEGNIPPMVHKWGQLHSDFANNLRPHMKRIIRILPFFIWQRWPEFCCFSFACILSRVHVPLHLIIYAIHCSLLSDRLGEARTKFVGGLNINSYSGTSDDSPRLQAGGFWNDAGVSSHTD